MSTRKAYAPIDVHAKAGTVWPAELPELTAPEIERAFRRLYRYGMGETWAGKIARTRGSRRAVRIGWAVNSRCAYLNPEQGWRAFVHDLSHWLDYLANGVSKHGKHHARFEAKLVREVLKRGWLDGRLRDEPKPEPTREDKLRAKRSAKLASILVRIESWTRKRDRALRALAKLERERKAAAKAEAAPIAPLTPSPPKPRKPSLRQQALALAERHGIEIEAIEGGHNVWPPEWFTEDNDHYHGDHYAKGWREVLEMVTEYSQLTEPKEGTTA